MPTYEYRCGACGHEMEAFQSIKARPLKKCPECSAMKLERLISGGGAVIFKGSGFYETDYRSKDYTQKAEAEKKAASGDGDSSKKSDSKSDSKTETKPEKKAGGDTKPAKSGDGGSSKSGPAKAGAKK
jgi:putative FmdB family regulatory protein